MRAAMLALPLLAILAQAPALDFTEEARLLYRVVACGNDSALPEGMDAKMFQKVALISMGCIAFASVAQVLIEIFRKHERGADHGRGR